MLSPGSGPGIPPGHLQAQALLPGKRGGSEPLLFLPGQTAHSAQMARPQKTVAALPQDEGGCPPALQTEPAHNHKPAAEGFATNPARSSPKLLPPQVVPLFTQRGSRSGMVTGGQGHHALCPVRRDPGSHQHAHPLTQPEAGCPGPRLAAGAPPPHPAALQPHCPSNPDTAQEAQDAGARGHVPH